MGSALDRLLAWVSQLPESWLYGIVAASVFVENLFPPLPADTVVLLGGFLAGQQRASAWTVYALSWVGNLAGAMLMYGLGRRYGPLFFHSSWGRLLLDPGQLRHVERFYQRFGVSAVFLSRFLPVFRAIDPVFAGTSHLPLWKAVPAMAAASAIWYGLVVYGGAVAGENWEELRRNLDRATGWLGAVALAVAFPLALWWWHSRRGESAAERSRRPPS